MQTVVWISALCWPFVSRHTISSWDEALRKIWWGKGILREERLWLCMLSALPLLSTSFLPIHLPEHYLELRSKRTEKDEDSLLFFAESTNLPDDHVFSRRNNRYAFSSHKSFKFSYFSLQIFVSFFFFPFFVALSTFGRSIWMQKYLNALDQASGYGHASTPEGLCLTAVSRVLPCLIAALWERTDVLMDRWMGEEEWGKALNKLQSDLEMSEH